MWLTPEKRFATCLPKESIPAITFGNSKHPEAWGSWERKYVPSALYYSCIMPIPSLQQKKTCLSCCDWKMWLTPEKRFATCLSKESIPAITFGNSKHPIPARSRFWELQYVPTPAFWLHHAHPFVAAEEKDLLHAGKQRAWSGRSGLQDLLQCCAMWLLQTNEQLLRLSF